MKHFKPNVVRGGKAIGLGNNLFLMKGRKHSEGGIDVGENPRTGLEVEDNEVMQVSPKGVKVFSAQPILGGKSPAQYVLEGASPYNVFNAQESWKKFNGVNDDGTQKKVDNRKEYVTRKLEDYDIFDDDTLALRQRFMESNFVNDSISPAGAKGAYQIMPHIYNAYVKRTGKKGDLTNYEYNKSIRDWLLAEDIAKNKKLMHDDQLPIVKLAKQYGAYNWGSGNLQKYLNNQVAKGIDINNSLDWLEGLPRETRDYINFIVLGKDANKYKTNSIYNQTLKQRGIKALGGNKPRTVTVNKGDSWISIANKNNINLDDLFKWNNVNPETGEGFRDLNPNDVLYLYNPYKLDASVVTADSPKDYVDFGKEGQKTIDKYARSLNYKDITIDDIPKHLQVAVMQRSINLAQNNAADKAAKVGLNLGMFLTNPIGYISGVAAQKGAAYLNDRVSGRNEYDYSDVLNYTPVRGRKYAKDNPVKSTLTDMAVGASPSALKNIFNNSTQLATAFRNAANNAAGTAEAMGINRISIPNVVKDIQKGHNYTSYSKGIGKSGNVVYKSTKNGYKPVLSNKGGYIHKASSNVSNSFLEKPISPVIPINSPISPLIFTPINAPIFLNRENPNRPLVLRNNGIYEQQGFNAWQLPYNGNDIKNFIPGTGSLNIKGKAPIGNAIEDQALTRESTTINKGYVPRISKYILDYVSGTPLNIYSGLGINYDESNPQSLIFGNYKYGGIHIKPSKRGTFTAAAKKHGMSVQGFASKVLANKSNYSPSLVKKAVFARNASKWHKKELGGQLNNNDMTFDYLLGSNRQLYRLGGCRKKAQNGIYVDGKLYNRKGEALFDTNIEPAIVTAVRTPQMNYDIDDNDLKLSIPVINDRLNLDTSLERLRQERLNNYKNSRIRNVSTNNNDLERQTLAANIIGNTLATGINAVAVASRQFPRNIPLRAVKQNTEYNVEPELNSTRETVAKNERDITDNTASSRVAVNRRQLARNLGNRTLNEIYGQKENIENDLVRRNLANIQNVGNQNIANINQWLANKAKFNNEKADAMSEALVAGINNTADVIGDYAVNKRRDKQYRMNLFLEFLKSPYAPGAINSEEAKQIATKLGIIDEYNKYFNV